MNTTVNTNEKTYTTKEVAEILGVTREQLKGYISYRPELIPSTKSGVGGKTNTWVWSQKDINRLINYYLSHRSNHRKTEFNIPTTMTPSTSTTTALTPVTANQNSALVDMFNEFINIEHEESVNENRAANRKFKFFFERMTEKELQKFFMPMLERFRYSYVTRHVNNVQSQTLTCIKRGTLKGIKKYELTYAAFLELCKFAADNNCPLELPQIEE